MACETQREQSGVRLRYLGRVDRTEIARANACLQNDPHADKVRCAISDYRAVDAVDIDAADYEWVVGTRIGAGYSNPRVAYAAIVANAELASLLEAASASIPPSVPFPDFRHRGDRARPVSGLPGSWMGGAAALRASAYEAWTPGAAVQRP